MLERDMALVARPCTTHCGLQYTLATGVEVNLCFVACRCQSHDHNRSDGVDAYVEIGPQISRRADSLMTITRHRITLAVPNYGLTR